MFSEQFHKSIYLGALILLAISLPFSVFMLSVAQLTLAVNWVLEGKFKAKLERIKERPSLWIITIFYGVHVLWMANTSDFSWGIHDLKIKLPMLALPLIVGTSAEITTSKLKAILKFYTAAIFLASLISAYYTFGSNGKLIHNVDDYYVSHIRFSLMVAMAIYIIFWLFTKETAWFRWLYMPICVWLIVFLLVLQSLTGIVIFIFTATILLAWCTFKYQNLMLRWFLVVVFFTIILLTSAYIIQAYARFHTFDKIDPASLEKYTAKGNQYWHNPQSKLVENGHFVDIYVCETELRESWKTRSKLNFDSSTTKYCLTRYLTSKGLRKDAKGVDQLTNREIKYIEMGKTNYIDTIKYSLYPRIYVALWELYNYKNGANPTGYSISQRLEFLKTGFHIIRKNLWFGVGTGDIPDAFAEQYELDKSPLAKDNRLRTHNQLVTFIITFGLVGFTFIICSLLLPPFFEKKYSHYLFLVIFIIGISSFLNEDTLETHQGISFFAFFYALFLFYNPKTPSKNVEI